MTHNRISVVNNWENLEYSANRKKIKNIYTVEVDDELFSVFIENRPVTVNDHSLSYVVNQKHYVFHKTVFGVPFKFSVYELTQKRIPVIMIDGEYDEAA